MSGPNDTWVSSYQAQASGAKKNIDMSCTVRTITLKLHINYNPSSYHTGGMDKSMNLAVDLFVNRLLGLSLVLTKIA
jgi:hypothetical protein